MPKLKISMPDSKTYRGWTFVLVAGVVLAIVALVDQGGGLAAAAAGDADGSSGCVVVVQVAEQILNVRDAPGTGSAIVGQLDNGARVDATTTVAPTPDGDFRQLEDGRWAAAQFLVPEAGSTC